MLKSEYTSPDVEKHLHQSFQRYFEQLESAELMSAYQALDDQVKMELEQVFLSSDYAAAHIQQHPDWLLDLMGSGDLHKSYSEQAYFQALNQRLQGIGDEASLSLALRQFRQREMVRIIWRDVNHLASFQNTVADLSQLADACIDLTLEKLYQFQASQWGMPYYPDSEEVMPMVVLGMGKLGAQELNLSSDIDLMFAYVAEGETRGGRRELAHRDYFIRLGQRLIKMLDEQTAYGFVFRVDMRLRPYGSSGALALNFRAMESYYEEQGREWERYAMIKARAIGRDGGDGAQLLQNLKPFVYRRYIDFGVIESLRELKKLINQEVLRKGNEDNIKIGAGGIREVEFIAQVLQLIRGGQDTELQHRNLLTVMLAIQKLGLLPEQTVKELCQDYIFLRNLEHRIQALQDRQTQQLPGDELSQQRIASGMGYLDWAAFLVKLNQVRDRVRTHFNALIAAPGEESDITADDTAIALWMQDEGDDTALMDLQTLGFSDTEVSWHLLKEFKGGRQVIHMQAVGRERLDKLMPLLIYACAQQEKGHITLERVLRLLEAVLRRSAYIALLVENPQSLDRLAMLFSASPWVADTIARFPMLLDELLNESTLLSPPDLASLKNELRQVLLRIPEDDLERQMDTLRQFKHGHVLRVAASELAKTLPIMKVSDYLTWLSETLLQSVLDMAWQQMTEKYGTPTKEDGTLCSPDFIILGYGKVGGIELSYHSDLDLVFVHDGSTSGTTVGGRNIENNVFFARLGQRIIHILTSKMGSGDLYETDMRLRPSGNSGLLVSSLRAFQEYQEQKAWMWERQALVRARVVAGCPRLAAKFTHVRQAVLCRSKEEATLKREVVEMRNKMLSSLSTYKTLDLEEHYLNESHEFHLKHDPGGVVDIEFLAQYLVLRYGSDRPDLMRWTDNMRILDSAKDEGLLTEQQVSYLQNAYLQYRSRTHTLALQNLPGKVPADQYIDERRLVREIWRETLS